MVAPDRVEQSTRDCHHDFCAGLVLGNMRSRPSWFNRTVSAVRTFGAANTLWGFLKSSMAATYLWGPLLTAWGFIAGWREGIATPYLLAACSLIFGGISWCAVQTSNICDWFRERNEKLKISYDRSIHSCRADVTFGDGSHAICFRLQIENTTTSKLEQCEGWLQSTDRFPNISPVKLFWISSPRAAMSVDLIKGVPRFLQICRITDKNRVIMATEDEAWPIDSLNAFHPGIYRFNIAVKGKDKAETIFYSVELNWSGNWTTSEMKPHVSP